MASSKKKSIFSNINDLVGIAGKDPVALNKSADTTPMSQVQCPNSLMAAMHSQALFLDHFSLIHQMVELAQRGSQLEVQGLTQRFPWLANQFLWSPPPSTSPPSPAAFPSIASAPTATGTVLMLDSSPGKGAQNPAQLTKLPPSLGARFGKAEEDLQYHQLPAHPPSSLAAVSQQASKAASGRQAPRFQCPDCNRSYSTFSGLSKHRQFHCTSQLKKQFSCKFCDKQYSSLGALKMHIRTHTLPCKCQMCGKAFSRPWLLQGHLRTHTGEKPFRCGHCGRSFADRSNLRAHLQTHSEVKKYRCKGCQKTFSRMSLLNKHESNGCPGILL